MQKSWFEVKYDAKNDSEYIVQVRDECTKNHKETEQPCRSYIMPENKDDRQCPVRSFKLYLSHLNPENDYLLQTPNRKAKDDCEVWYTKHLGKNPLGSFVAKLCEKIGTSKHYTNHCVRVSSTSTVTQCGKFKDKEIMDLTSHKSVQSLTIYQRVWPEKKLQMAKHLTKFSLIKNQWATTRRQQDCNTHSCSPSERPANWDEHLCKNPWENSWSSRQAASTIWA